MPIYEYSCNKCEMVFSLIKFAGKQEDTSCPRCGSKDVRKNISTFSALSGGYTHSSHEGGG